MRVLIYHKLNIGDLVLASPALQLLQRKHPGASVRIVVNDLAELIAPWLPGVTEVDAYSRYGSGKSEWQALLRARNWRPDLAVALCPTPDWKLALRFLALPNGVGFATDEWLYRIAYSKRKQVPSSAMHVAEILALLFGFEDASQLPGVRLDCDRAIRFEYDVWMHVSARKPSDRPSAGQIAGVVGGIRDAMPGARIAITTVPAARLNPAHASDESLAAELRARFRGQSGIDLLSPDLPEAIDIIRGSRSAISAHGGLMHVAAAFGKPVVGLLGNIGAEHWRPYSAKAKWLQAPSKRVAEIEPAEIVRTWKLVAGT